jgi:hypothetical protein
VPVVSAIRASSLAMVLVTATTFVGGGGWMAGRTTDRNDAAPALPAPAAAPAPVVQGHGAHAHHAHHVEGPSTRPAAGRHHDHDCENGVCRCDSRCPPRRSGPCGGAMRSCQGAGDEAGLGPGPVRPFLLSAAFVPGPGFERLGPPDSPFVAVTRAPEPVAPPPRTSSI